VILLLPPSGSISSAIPSLVGADNRSRRLVEEFECGHGFYRKIERLVSAAVSGRSFETSASRPPQGEEIEDSLLIPRHCERSEAIPLSLCRAMNCFAALAVTETSFCVRASVRDQARSTPSDRICSDNLRGSRKIVLALF